MSDKKNKSKVKHQLPSENGVDVMGLLNNISIIPKKQKNIPPDFALEIGVPANNIAEQLQSQEIEFDPSIINTYDNLIKSIVRLKTEKFISKKKSQKLIFAIYERSIKHVYFIYEMIQDQIMEDIKVKVVNPVDKKDWENILNIMNKNNRQFGFVDYNSNGKIEFYDSDPFIDGVHGMPVDKKRIEEIIKDYK